MLFNESTKVVDVLLLVHLQCLPEYGALFASLGIFEVLADAGEAPALLDELIHEVVEVVIEHREEGKLSGVYDKSWRRKVFFIAGEME